MNAKSTANVSALFSMVLAITMIYTLGCGGVEGKTPLVVTPAVQENPIAQEADADQVISTSSYTQASVSTTEDAKSKSDTKSEAKPDEVVETSSEPTRYALLVGVRAYYPDRFSPLPGAEPDITELAKVLGQKGFDRNNITLMTNTFGASDPRQLPLAYNIRKQLKKLAKQCTPNDTVIVALAGHGVQPGGKQYFFCPFDADLEDKDTLISMDEIYDALGSCKASFKLLLVDACREDTLATNSKSSNVETTMPGMPEPPAGTAVFVSCSKGQLAFERQANGRTHGVFFHSVIEGLKGAAVGEDGTVTLPDLERYVKKNVESFVRKSFQSEQFPVLKNNTTGLHAIVEYSLNDDQLKKIRWLILRDRYSEAAAIVEELLAANPNDGVALAERARVIAYMAEQTHDLSRMDEALQAAQKAIELSPGEAMPHVAMANILRLQKNYELSLTSSQKALKRDPNCTLAHVVRAGTFFAMKNFDAMIKETNTALEIDPEHPEARALYAGYLFHVSKMEEGHAELDRAIAINPDIGAFYWLKGYGHEQMGDHNKAIIQYTSAIKLNDKRPEYFVRRALSLGNAGDYPAAWKDVQSATELAPEYEEIISARAMLLVNQQKWKEALIPLTEGLKRNPDANELLFGRGYAYIYTKQFSLAAADLNHLLELKPESSEAHMGLGVIDLMHNRLDSALVHVGRATRYNDLMGEAHYITAAIHIKKNNFAAAIKPLSRAIELDPKNFQYYQQRAMLLTRIGRSSEAQSDMLTYQRLQRQGQ